MKAKKIIAVLMIVVILAVTLVACSAERPADMVGTWVYISRTKGMQIVLNEDGTGEYTVKRKKKDIKYWSAEDGNLTINKEGENSVCTYALSEDGMKLTISQDGQTLTLDRVVE